MGTSTNIVFHYTDMNALISILRKDHIVLRATNCMYLNDTREIIEGITSVERVLKQKIEKSTFKNHYITSFSQNQDSLNMWGMYAANGYGCAIGLRQDILSKHYGMCVKCVYGEDDIDKTLSNFINLSQTGCITPMGIHKTENQQDTQILNGLFRMFSKNVTFLSTCLCAKKCSLQA